MYFLYASARQASITAPWSAWTRVLDKSRGVCIIGFSNLKAVGNRVLDKGMWRLLCFRAPDTGNDGSADPTYCDVQYAPAERGDPLVIHLAVLTLVVPLSPCEQYGTSRSLVLLAPYPRLARTSGFEEAEPLSFPNPEHAQAKAWAFSFPFL